MQNIFTWNSPELSKLIFVTDVSLTHLDIALSQISYENFVDAVMRQ